MNSETSHRPSLARRIDVSNAPEDALPKLLNRQWLLTNGLGGFALGTLGGSVTWRYHGLLISALPAPLGRMVMLNHLDENLRMPDGTTHNLGGAERNGSNVSPSCLVEFGLDHQMPYWRFELPGAVIEKRLVMPYLQNTIHINYSVVSASREVRLQLRPSVHFRPLEGSVAMPTQSGLNYEVRHRGRFVEIDSRERCPPLRIALCGAELRFIHDGGSIREIFYSRDAERGLEARGSLWSPGYFSLPLREGAAVTMIASTEEWHTITALDPEAAIETERDRRRRLLRLAHPKARDGAAADLVMSADQFIIAPAGRVKDAARARAHGDELRSVIAGYPWFTDWGRDTMISLEGLTLVTGRAQEAAWILRTFAQYVRDGLVPNLFPEGSNEGLYHTADATMWFFHAIDRYVRHTGDRDTLFAFLPILKEIVRKHVEGTKFGIGVDPADGLLRQGQEGWQLTWMDAKVGDWVVTPRRGKAVEINALWYNALKLMETWLKEANEPEGSAEMAARSRQVFESFNRKFWNPDLDCLYDVVDAEQGGNDASIRPNQIFAISMTHPVLASERWEAVLKIVESKLLTPVGLRTLSPDHKDYKAKYTGDLRSRDAAYHQGTVWPWLIGPFIDAWLKIRQHERAEARKFLENFVPHLDEVCVGSISEIFDAEPPYAPRGCIAQAWSVAEVLRCLVLASDDAPKSQGPGP